MKPRILGNGRVASTVGVLCAFALISQVWTTSAAQDASRSAKSPDVVYVPTPNDVVAKMLEVAKVSQGDLVYDLGCGDGRIVVTAAQTKGCKCIGFEISPERIKEALNNVRANGVEDLVQIVDKDIFSVDLSEANVITLYLLPKLNVRLIPQLEKLQPGSRIVSHNYGMKGIKPDRIIRMVSREDGVQHTIYLWTTPLKKEPDN